MADFTDQWSKILDEANVVKFEKKLFSIDPNLLLQLEQPTMLSLLKEYLDMNDAIKVLLCSKKAAMNQPKLGEPSEVPSPGNSPNSSPPKPKKSKVDEFTEKIKSFKNDSWQVALAASDMIKDLEKDNELITIQKNVAEAELKLRPGLELLQRRVIPTWLLNLELDFQSMWYTAIELRVTSAACYFAEEIERSEKLLIDDFVTAMTLLYQQSTDQLSHMKNVSTINLTEEEWALVFRDIKVDPGINQDAIMLAMSNLNGHAGTKYLKNKKRPHFVFYLREIKFCLTKKSITQAENQVKNMFVTSIKTRILRISFPKKNRVYTRQMFVLILNVDQTSEKHGIIQTLKNCGYKNPFIDSFEVDVFQKN